MQQFFGEKIVSRSHHGSSYFNGLYYYLVNEHEELARVFPELEIDYSHTNNSKRNVVFVKLRELNKLNTHVLLNNYKLVEEHLSVDEKANKNKTFIGPVHYSGHYMSIQDDELLVVHGYPKKSDDVPLFTIHKGEIEIPFDTLSKGDQDIVLTRYQRYFQQLKKLTTQKKEKLWQLYENSFLLQEACECAVTPKYDNKENDMAKLEENIAQFERVIKKISQYDESIQRDGRENFLNVIKLFLTKQKATLSPPAVNLQNSSEAIIEQQESITPISDAIPLTNANNKSDIPEKLGDWLDDELRSMQAQLKGIEDYEQLKQYEEKLLGFWASAPCSEHQINEIKTSITTITHACQSIKDAYLKALNTGNLEIVQKHFAQMEKYVYCNRHYFKLLNQIISPTCNEINRKKFISIANYLYDSGSSPYLRVQELWRQMPVMYEMKKNIPVYLRPLGMSIRLLSPSAVEMCLKQNISPNSMQVFDHGVPFKAVYVSFLFAEYKVPLSDKEIEKFWACISIIMSHGGTFENIADDLFDALIPTSEDSSALKEAHFQHMKSMIQNAGILGDSPLICSKEAVFFDEEKQGNCLNLLRKPNLLEVFCEVSEKNNEHVIKCIETKAEKTMSGFVFSQALFQPKILEFSRAEDFHTLLGLIQKLCVHKKFIFLSYRCATKRKWHLGSAKGFDKGEALYGPLETHSYTQDYKNTSLEKRPIIQWTFLDSSGKKRFEDFLKLIKILLDRVYAAAEQLGDEKIRDYIKALTNAKEFCWASLCSLLLKNPTPADKTDHMRFDCQLYYAKKMDLERTNEEIAPLFASSADLYPDLFESAFYKKLKGELFTSIQLQVDGQIETSDCVQHIF